MNLKVLILLLYYERPQMIRNALNSVLRANKQYQNWHLALIDDCSPSPGKPIVEETMKDHLDKVNFYNTNTNIEDKLKTGSIFGKFMNQAILDSDADVAIMLCDDDELVADYLFNLNRFFSVHPKVPACYSHVHLYNPAYENSDFVDNTLFHQTYNDNFGKINPAGKTDASQVAWQTFVNKSGDIWFDYPKTRCLDEAFYKKISKKYGKIPFSQFNSQYKCISHNQLINVKEADVWKGKSLDLTALEQLTTNAELIDMINRYSRQGKFEEAVRIKEKSISMRPDANYIKKVIIDKYAPIKSCPYRSPRAISEAIRDILNGKDVCELGCSAGDNMVFISQFAKSVYGIEIDEKSVRMARSRGLCVTHGNYRELPIPKADVYYFWPQNGDTDNRYLVKRILSDESFSGTIVVAGDTGYPKEIPSVKECGKLGDIIEVPFAEGRGDRQNGVFNLAIINADLGRSRMRELNW